MLYLSKDAINGMIGKKYDMLTVTGVAEVIDEGWFHKYKFKCKCDCGNEVIRVYDNLYNDKIYHSCGCAAQKKSKESKQAKAAEGKYRTGPKDPNKYVGFRLGITTGTNEWKYFRINAKTPVDIIKYKFRCDCGGEIWYGENQIGTYKKQMERGIPVYCNCGCRRSEVAKEAAKNIVRDIVMDSKSHLYKVWTELTYRCYSPDYRYYHQYGALGIRMDNSWYDPCDRTKSFLRFKSWMVEHGYREDSDEPMTIGRYDRNKDYCPDNCYVDKSSLVSKRANIKYAIEYKGEVKSFNELELSYGVYTGMIKSLMKKNVSADVVMYLLLHPDCHIDRKTNQIVDVDGFTRLVRKTGAKYILN